MQIAAVVAASLPAAAGARADGDPASDVLPTADVFLPYRRESERPPLRSLARPSDRPGEDPLLRDRARRAREHEQARVSEHRHRAVAVYSPARRSRNAAVYVSRAVRPWRVSAIVVREAVPMPVFSVSM